MPENIGLQLTPLEEGAAEHYNAKALGPDRINRLLGPNLDYSVYHHFGLGSIPNLEEVFLLGNEDEMKKILHGLERAESEYLVGLLKGKVNSNGRVLDAGSGSGGTAFDLNAEYNCEVDGVNIADKQVDLTNRIARQRGVDDKVRFHLRNMRQTGFPDNTFDAAVTNETTMYVELDGLYRELARVLKVRGVYAMVSWCRSDNHIEDNPFAQDIDRHYGTRMHSPNTYLSALRRHGFGRMQIEDLTREAFDYWGLRIKLPSATGVEKPFLDGFAKEFLKYISIWAELDK